MLAKYSSICDELSACLEGLALMRPFNSGGNGDVSEGELQAGHKHMSPSATLGDFRIERELGRAGLGVGIGRLW